MKKITKRIMALMLSLVMILGCVPSFFNEASANGISTIGEVLATVEFPTSISEEIPDNAWVSEGKKLYIYNNCLYVYTGSNTTPLIALDGSVSTTEGGYSLTVSPFTYKFVMTGDNLTSIIINADGPYNFLGTYEPAKKTITEIVLNTNNGMNPTLGEGMPNLNPVESKQRPLNTDIFDGYIDNYDDGWYLTPECNDEKCTGTFQKDTTYYYKRHYEISKKDEYVFANSVSIDFVSDIIQYELISDTKESEYVHSLIIKIVPSKKKFSLSGTESSSYLNMIMSMSDIDYDSYPITGHSNVNYVVCHFTNELDLYGSIKFNDKEYISVVKSSKPSDEDIYNAKCFIINGDPGFDVYFVYDWGKTQNLTINLQPGTTVLDALLNISMTSGSFEEACMREVEDGVVLDGNLQGATTLEAGKTYKILLSIYDSEASFYNALKVNNVALTLNDSLQLTDDGYKIATNTVTVYYTFECKNPSTGGSSKKYKTTNTSDSAEKISGSGKKGSTRTITPIEGKKVSSVIVTDKDGNKVDVTINADGTYSFVQPASDVTIEVNYKNREITLNIGSTEASVDEEKSNLDVSPVVRNDRTMLPIRFVAENLGAKVEWNEKKPDYVAITRGDTKIEITLGSDIMLVNGKEIKLDSVAFAENDRTYLPVRAISEALNAIVEWNEERPMEVKIYER